MADPEDVPALAARIEGLLDDVPLRRRMGEASRRRAVEHFDYGVLAARLGGVLGTGPQ
jgi:type III pantothenate kinase